MKNRNTDYLIGTTFLLLTLVFIALTIMHQSFFDWIFKRHQNLWSWYLRPILLLPFCYFSYKKSFSGIMISIFALFTSMFWFPEPEIVNSEVKRFLEFEKEYISAEWSLYKTILFLTIPISLTALSIAFWKRSLATGIGVIVLMAVGKMIWSIQNAGDSGTSILAPALLGLLICCGIVFLSYKRLQKK